MDLTEKKISSRQVFDGVVVKLFVDEVELPDGKKSVREVVRHPGAVCVIPVTDKGEVIMVRQYRYAFGQPLLEVPAGKLEPGEDPLEAAMRELEEETGTVAKSIEHIGELYTTVAIIDEKIQMYLATGLTYKNAHPDDGEFLETVVMPLDEGVELVMTGEIDDAKTQVALLKAKRMLNGKN